MSLLRQPRFRRSMAPGTLAILAAIAWIADSFAEEPQAGRPEKSEERALFGAFDRMLARSFVDKVTGERRRVPAGTAKEAWDYYGEISRQLGFLGDEAPPTLDGLLAYFGYEHLKAADVESLPSHVLMDYARLRQEVSNPSEFAAAFDERPFAVDEILAARYFSPKTTDVSGKVKPAALSWRKIVRLKARVGSAAEEHGAASMYWLGVAYVPLSDQSPFGGHAHNNQVMITRDETRTGQNAAYWLVYGSLADGGKLTTHTETSWDAPKPSEKPGVRAYHVPESCMYCHGHSTSQPKLNYFDTDHWLDRVQAGDDFSQLADSRWPVLSDAGADPEPEQFERTFGVFRKLNTEIARQNRAVEEDGFETRAAENWLRLHQDDSRHVPPLGRGIPGPRGETWNADRETDRQLLPLLNRYCYRCHSSLMYHVFDKAAVLERVDMMTMFLEEEDPDFRMPQDRELSTEVKQRLIGLLEALQKENDAANQ